MEADVFSATGVEMVERIYDTRSEIHIKVHTATGQEDSFHIYTNGAESVPVTIKMPKRDGAKARVTWDIVEGV